MKRKNNEGFTLIETLIAIVVLGIVVVPVCSSLVMSFRMNEKADALLQDQLAVSSVVETLMAEGISKKYVCTVTNPDDDGENYGWMEVEVNGSAEPADRFPGVAVKTEPVVDDNLKPYYKVTVSDEKKQTVIVETYIRASQEGGGT